MECCLPFDDKDMCVSFVVFKPMEVVLNDFVEALKEFSFYTTKLGCIQSSILKSIHGNMIIWYGAWAKRSIIENIDLLTETLLQKLTNVSDMATLTDLSFFDAYAGESIDASAPSLAKFSSNNTISMISVAAAANYGRGDNDINDISYACLAIFKSRFRKMEGVVSGVCLKCINKPSVVSFYVWKSLPYCYSWILNSDHMKSMLPYLDSFSLSIKYDIFQVVTVIDTNIVLCFQHLDHDGERKA